MKPPIAEIYLHEDLAQQLAGLALLLEAATTRLERETHPLGAQLRTVHRHLRDIILRVRTGDAGLTFR